MRVAVAAPSEPRLQEAGGYQLRCPEPTLSQKTARPKKWRLLRSESQDEKKDEADLTQTEAQRQVRLRLTAPGPSQASRCKSIICAASQGSEVARCWASLHRRELAPHWGSVLKASARDRYLAQRLHNPMAWSRPLVAGAPASQLQRHPHPASWDCSTGPGLTESRPSASDFASGDSLPAGGPLSHSPGSSPAGDRPDTESN